MSVKVNPETHIGRCRCEDCERKYKPRDKNQNVVFYYVPPEYVPTELLCSNCFKHGGIIISEDALKSGVAVFARGPGWQLTTTQKKHAKKRTR